MVVADMFLGHRINRIRAQGGLKQREVAERIGINISIVSLWSRNLRPVPTQRVAQLAEALETSPAQLFDTPELLGSYVRALDERLEMESKVVDEAPPPEPWHPAPKLIEYLRREDEPHETQPVDTSVPYWQAHIATNTTKLTPTLPMGGRRPVVKGRVVQTYGPVGRIADL